jgi:hypothetical protein
MYSYMVGTEVKLCGRDNTFFHSQILTEIHKAYFMLRKTGYWMWSILEIIGIFFRNLTLIYIRTAYGMKVITQFNEYESFPISKLCWANIFQYLLWDIVLFWHYRVGVLQVENEYSFVAYSTKHYVAIYIYIYIYTHRCAQT